MSKLAVAGATGVIGKVIVQKAEEAGHDVVKLCRAEGVDLLENDGLAETLQGVDAVIDASQVGDPMADDPITPIVRAAQNLISACATYEVKRLVMLSINGVEKPELQEFPFYKARFEQEELVRNADFSTTVVRSAQWFEFALNPAASEVTDSEVKAQNWAIQPAAMDSVAQFLVEAAEGRHGEGTVVVAGSERLTLPELTERYLSATDDSREVTTVDAVLPALADGSLHAPDDAVILEPSLDEWLKKQ
ncbi:MAG: NAD(P)H-binding protein [Rothia sp. (in: high G+C Gram-positive bacteria)]|nr:NAD(P)H-binding protein [Rothia sp. (in: high G+C Gram-positive bacteria)]